jgi:hypothetical protein
MRRKRRKAARLEDFLAAMADTRSTDPELKTASHGEVLELFNMNLDFLGPQRREC